MSLAFVFPGQGSQSVGLLSALAQVYPAVQRTFVEASDALGRDLWAISQAGPEEELNRTENTQPVMLAADVAVWRVWRAQGGAMPAYMAGHSLGEYAALVCAEAMAFTDAVRVVGDRARYMQEAVPAGQGGMAAVLGLDDEAVKRVCEQAAQGEVLSAVNFNSPGQVVIAGTAAAIARAVDAAKAAGAKRAVPLPVSVPSHCALMAPAAERMATRLKDVAIQAPRVPVLHNVHVRPEQSADAIRDALVRQIAAPVRWVETVQTLCAAGVDKLIECGPGKVLTGLNKRIAPDASHLAIVDPATLDQALAAAR